MTELNVNTLFHKLNHQKYNPVYLVLGKQNYISKLIKKAFINMIPKSQRVMNLSSYDMESTSIQALVDDAKGLPFLGKYHLILVHNPYFLTGKRDKFVNPKIKKANTKNSLKNLSNYLKAPNQTTIMVIFAPYPKIDKRRKINKLLLKDTTVLNLNHVQGAFVSSYIANQIGKHGYAIKNDSLNLLIRRTGNNLSEAMHALPQLFMYSVHAPNKEITKQAIKNIIPAMLNENIFTLVNDVLKGETAQADSLYHNLIKSGQPPLSINALLLSQFRVLIQTWILNNQHQNQWQIARTLRVNPYRIKLALQSNQHFTFYQLSQAYLGLVQTEIKLKSGSNDPELLFEMLMTKYTLATKKHA